MNYMKSENGRILLKLFTVQFFRITGIFIIIPVLGIYSVKFTDVPFLIGLPLAAYEIATLIMQIPAGYVSRKFSKKKYIVTAMLIFTVGSILSYFSNNIFELVTARIITGIGAISTPVGAYSQQISEKGNERRNSAVIGIATGLGVLIGFGFSPLLSEILGIRNMFIVISLMGLAGLVSAISLPSNEKKFFNDLESKESFIYNGKNVAFGYITIFTVSFSVFSMIFILQFLNLKIIGSFSYGILYFLIFLISGIISVALNEYSRSNEKIKKFMDNLSIPILLIGILIFSIVYNYGLNFIIGEFSEFLIFLGYSMFEIALLPRILSAYSKNQYELGTSFLYTMQYGGNTAGIIISSIFISNVNTLRSFEILLLITISITIAGTVSFILWNIGNSLKKMF
ncbi:MFS transporter [Caldiplasma sukawensis]